MDIYNMTYTDKWNLFSMDMIEGLQKRFQEHEWWLVNASVIGDNRQAFLFFFPLLTGLLSAVGVKALWAAILVEWSNIILKWAFKGDRPYWWTNTSPLYDAGSRPKLQQFFNTCESGPGTPSGHIMMNVAIFYIIARGIKSSLSRSSLYKIVEKPLSLLVTVTCLMWIVIVFMSRLYIQSHFLHQCVFGAIVGYLIGRFVWYNNWLMRSHLFYSVLFTTLLIGSSLGTYCALLQHGLDPLWSIPLAQKYCISSAFVKVDTQPYFLMVRFTAAALGLGIALSSHHRRYFLTNKRSRFLKLIILATLNVLVGRGCLALQGLLPADQLQLYLVGSFVLYLMLPYIVIVVIPTQVSKIIN